MPKRKKLILAVSAALVVIIGILVFLWYRSESSLKPTQTMSYAMGTYVQQTVYGAKASEAEAAASQCIKDLENLISWRVSDSDVAKVNAAAGGDWVTIDGRTSALLAQAMDVAQKSDGAYDPVILPISSLWDFGGDNQRLPSKEEIEKNLPFVGYKGLQINTQQNLAKLNQSGMGIDLGGIGKGAACDEAVAAYASVGAKYGVIAVGGSIGVYGTKQDGSPWHIAIRDPETDDSDAGSMGQLDITSGFVSTSGTYEKYFVQDGVTYHHLLNPKTGYPENNGLISVTVKADNGALSDALSTACFILGIDDGKALLAQYGAEGIFIDSSQKVYVTGLTDQFTITNSAYALAN